MELVQSNEPKIVKETKEVQLSDNNKTMEAKFYLEQAAESVRQPGDVLLGTYAVHMYQNPITRQVVWQIQKQIGAGMTENILAESLTQVRTSLMAVFGKKG